MHSISPYQTTMTRFWALLWVSQWSMVVLFCSSAAILLSDCLSVWL